MKDKILTLIIGILIGAIISTTVLILIKGNTSNNKMPGFDPSNMEFFEGSEDFKENFKDRFNRNETIEETNESMSN